MSIELYEAIPKKSKFIRDLKSDYKASEKIRDDNISNVESWINTYNSHILTLSLEKT